MTDLHKGTPETREFYDRVGWTRQDGVLVDTHLFGGTRGPIRDALQALRHQRVLEAIGGPGQHVAELGCGGTPAVFLASKCAAYTAVDFSTTGLAEAAKALQATRVPVTTVQADVTALPFPDATFDAVYSAHAIYHIDTAAGQAAAFSEALRVVKPGGRAVFILSNPYPLLFPYRALRRVIAMTPGVGALANRLRRKPPLPYLPMPLGWMRRQLEHWGEVEIISDRIASVHFDKAVSETSTLGRAAWRAMQHLEADRPHLAARLGNYVIIAVRKSR